MKNKKIIAFLVKYKLTKTEFTNLFFSNLNKIFKIKLIDISELTLKKKILILRSKIKEKKIFYNKVKNISDLKKILLNVDFVYDHNQSIIDDRIINNFFKNKKFEKLKILGTIGGIIPNFLYHDNIKKIFFIFIFIFNALKYKKFSLIIKSLKKFLIIYFQSLNNKYKSYDFTYDYILIDSDLSEKHADHYYNNCKKIHVHYKDYERHLLEADNKQYQNNYAVFLDEAIFNHPDNFELQSENILNLKNNICLYFKDLNNFFDNFEKQTNCKIFIAAHPRGFLNFDYENYFNRRKISRNNTYELIKKSKLVFTHSSTSIAYAVVLRKPIIFLNSYLMLDIGYFTKILSFSIETGSKIIDINSNNINYNNLFNKDFSLYKNYLNKFVKSSNSKNKSLWNIVGSEINK